MPGFKVCGGVENFCIVAPNGDESPLAAWGEVAAIKVGNAVYICFGDDGQDEQMVEKVLTTIQVPTETEDGYVFEGEAEPAESGDDEPGDDDEDDEDDDEQHGPELVAS